MMGAKSFIFRFGDFEVREREFSLIKAGEVLPVEPKAFRALLFLLHNPQKLIPKEDLVHAVWGDTAVADGSLTRCIWLLRRLLGDDFNDPRYIVTVATVGYRFICPVEISEDASANLEEIGKSVGPAEADALQAPSKGKPTPAPPAPRPWRRFGSVVLIAPLLAGGLYYSSHQNKRLTDKDTIVLADFDNRTADPVFDDALRQGLSVQLEQSPFLSIISDQQVQQTMQMMTQKPGAKLTPPIASDVCKRTGSAAVINGSIVQIGSEYNLILKAVNCVSGELRASTEARASDKNHVLDALSKAATAIRRKLGESQGTIQKFDMPLEKATTPSLEALKAYTIGIKTSRQGENATAIPFLQRAIELDHDFAMAYAGLGNLYAVTGETGFSIEYTKKAYQLRESVSERERFYIETHYYDYVTEDVEKITRESELWEQIYPRDQVPRSNLAATYRTLGQYDKSLSEARETLRLGPDGAENYTGLVSAYLALGRLDDAQRTFEQAEAKNFDSLGLRFTRYKTAFLQNDRIGMEQQVTWSLDRPKFHDIFVESEAKTSAYFGQISKARELYLKAADLARHSEVSGRAAGHEAGTALQESLVGNAVEAKRWARASLLLSPGSFQASLAFALAGNVRAAQEIVNDLRKRNPENLEVQYQQIPTIQALLALNRKDVANALDDLESTRNEAGEFFPIYVRGLVYLAAHRGGEAAAEFQKILDHRGVVTNNLIGALAHIQIARAYAAQGDSAKAKAAYQDFLTLWKDADPDIPILKEAKAEYSKL